MSTTLIVAGVLASVGPYGAVMGDGLDLMPPGGTSEAITNPCPGDDTLFGIDVSYYQDTIDWDAVKADGVDFAFIRVSHSLQFYDPEFDTNWESARAVGLHAGVYQYFEPDEDPIAQADLLLDAMGPLGEGDLPPVIDVESTAGLGGAAIADAVEAWLLHVEDQLGVRPIIYTNGYFWQDNVGSDAFVDYPVWIAHYGVECPNTPSPWVDFQFHQYTDSGSVAGIGGPVDSNIFNGTLDQLLALGTGEVFVCGVLPPEGGEIDNGDECFREHGDPQYWREEADGIGGSLLWTNATDFETPSNYAVWTVWVEESGTYELSVNITPPYAETTMARYVVTHAGGEAAVPIDQSAADGWVSLGEYNLVAGEKFGVRLDDNTGEPNDAELGIVVDALQVTRLDGGSDESGGADDESGDGDVAPDDGDDGDSGDGTGGDDGGGSSGDTYALPPADCREGDCDGGCSCSSDAPRPSGLWALVLPWAWRRRRRA